MMTIETQIFYDLLHESRRLKGIGWERKDRQAYRLGMLRTYCLHLEDIRAGQNIADVWRHQNSGAEPCH